MKNQNNKKTFWEIFVLNRRFTIMLAILIAILGVSSISSIPKESNPEVDIPIIIINTVFPGANPMDVEELVTQTIEDKLSSLDDLSELSSVSQNGLSSIVVEFDADANKDEKLQDVKDEVDKVLSDLPDDAMEPIITDVNINNAPILRLSLSGPYDIALLKEWGSELSDELEKIPGVSEAEVLGGRDREVQVLVSKSSLDKYGLSLLQVTSSIGNANSDVPVGSIETGGENYTLSFDGRLETVDELRSIPIATIGANVVYVSDIAEVVDTFEEVSSMSRFTKNGEEAQEAVSINLKRASGGNILEIVDSSILITREYQQKLPTDISIDIIENLAEDVRGDLYGLSASGLQTILIVILVLLAFVGWRGAALAAVSIPLTFFISFTFLSIIGYTLNFLTLFSLILSLGILVDSTIVITEGIVDFMRKGKSAWEAAISSIREYQSSLISGSLTTIFVFIPMLVVTGIVGKFMRSIPVTVAITLLASLFVALGIVSALAARWMITSSEKGNQGFKIVDKFMDKFAVFYDSFIKKIFKSKKMRFRFWAIVAIFAVFSLSLPATGALPINMFPPASEDSFVLNISSSYGTPLKTTSENVKKIEEILIGNKNIESLQTNIGSINISSLGSASVTSGDHLAYIVVSLYEDRSESSQLIAEEVRDDIDQLDLGSMNVLLVEESAGPPTGSAIEVKLSGESLEDLQVATRLVEQELNKIDGAINIDSTVESTNGEFKLYIDRAKAKSYGLSALDAATELRNAVTGLDATTIRKDGDEIAVVVKYALGSDIENTKKVNLSIIEGLTIKTKEGEIPLSSFVSTGLAYNRAYVSHIDAERIEKVTANLRTGVQAVEINSILKDALTDIDMPEGINYSLGGETDDVTKSFGDMGRAFLIGVLAIFLLLIFQFNSYRQPLFVIVTIPFSIIGVFPGLLLFHQSLSFPGMIGIVAAAGVVVNSAILLLDVINKRRAQGDDMETAIIEGTKSRLRPILMTTITTVFGMIPLTMSSPTWSPIAYSMISGLTVSLVFTLVAVPLLYQRFAEDKLDTVY